MRIYSNLTEIKEISILVDDINELLKLKDFIEHCIDEINTNIDFEHEHFSDFIENKNYNLLQNPEVIICK